MKLSPETIEKIQGIIGQKPTPKRINDWLDALAAVPSELPDLGTEDDLSVEDKRRAIRTFVSRSRPYASLEEAAKALFEVLEPRVQDGIRDVAREMKIPVWVVFCGAVTRAADHRELHAGDFAPDWLNTPSAINRAPMEVRCTLAGCDLVIPTPVRGQTRCCSRHGSDQPQHSENCVAAFAAGLLPPSPAGAPTPGPMPDSQAEPVPGVCRFCKIAIFNPAPGQAFCCSAHGSGQEEHSEGCVSLAMSDRPLESPSTLD